MSESAPPTYTMPDGFGVVAALTIAPDEVSRPIMSPETTVRWTPARWNSERIAYSAVSPAHLLAATAV